MQFPPLIAVWGASADSLEEAIGRPHITQVYSKQSHKHADLPSFTQSFSLFFYD
jgi:hypothetical protein